MEQEQKRNRIRVSVSTLLSRMNTSGHTTVRGPFVSIQKRKVADLVESHVFNSEVTCYLPNSREKSVDETPIEEVKRLELGLQC